MPATPSFICAVTPCVHTQKGATTAWSVRNSVVKHACVICLCLLHNLRTGARHACHVCRRHSCQCVLVLLTHLCVLYRCLVVGNHADVPHKQHKDSYAGGQRYRSSKHLQAEQRQTQGLIVKHDARQQSTVGCWAVLHPDTHPAHTPCLQVRVTVTTFS